MAQKTFQHVLLKVGKRPSLPASQNVTRHYSETLSKEIALWLRDYLISEALGANVLTPEAKIPTIYGGKSLDVGVVDQRGYLLLDISIKTFNFKDKQTQNYRHNYTGRFYELLGEELDLRRSYRWSTLVAMIFLPEDCTEDSSPSSFAHAVRQFSKIASTDLSVGLGFEHVFVGVHGPTGSLYFFNAAEFPPKEGPPPPKQSLHIEDVLAVIRKTVEARRSHVAADPLPTHIRYKFVEPARKPSALP